MFERRLLVLTFLLSLSTVPAAADYEVLSGSYGWVHDPVMTSQDNTYYVFHTGDRTPIKKSTDMHYWQSAGYVWPSFGQPDWWEDEVPLFSGNIWAPDISYFNGKYHLYYSISSWGSNTSCIGLATNTTLHSSDPNYAWVDSGGPVICSAGTNYNAIDPALFIDENGPMTRYWLSFGSFWTGLKLTEIDSATGYPIDYPPVIHSIAYNTKIEAPFIIYRDGYYYLFVSHDSCCQGSNSTYNIRVGRSTNVTGTYYDRNGTSMMSGGGNRLTWNDERWKGPGHNAVFKDNDDSYWFVHHAYDSYNSGQHFMRIHELFWTSDGWPTLAEQGPVDVNEAMVAWWKLDEGSGVVAEDSSISDYNGVISGAAWINDDFYRGTVLSFDGDNDYIFVPEGFSDFDGLTISVWAHPTSVKRYARFIDFGKGEGDNNILFGRSSTSNNLFFEIWNGTTRLAYVTANDAIQLNEWQHFAATVDVCGYSVLYKNGSPIQTGTTSPPWNVTRDWNFIARSNWTTHDYYQGRLDDIRIYDKTLDANDISYIYQQGLAPSNCTLVHNLGFGLVPDWAQDCYIDFYDLAFLANAWLNDFDSQDLADLVTYWLQCNNPEDANCTPNW